MQGCRRVEKCESTAIIGTVILLIITGGIGGCRDRVPAKEAGSPAVPSPTPLTQKVTRETECKAFVQEFYGWYFGQLEAYQKAETSGPSKNHVLLARPEVLDPKLRQMLEQDAEAQSKNADSVVGLDFDPFLNAQDWEGRYQMRGATMSDGTCRVSMWGLDSGKQREIVDPELVERDGKWVFRDFSYPADGAQPADSLTHILARLQNQRQHADRQK